MALVETINDQLKSAMKAQDKARTLALRNIRAAFIVGMKETGADTLSDEAAIEQLRRLAKQRQDSIMEYGKANRADLVAQEQAELAVIEEFLPRLADAETTRAWVVEAIARAGARGPGDMGRVMGQLMAAHKAELDGKLAQALVREELGRLGG